MNQKNTAALYWAGTVALVAAAAAVLIDRARRAPAVPLDIPERWELVRTLHPEAQARFLKLYRRIESELDCLVILTSGHRPGLANGAAPAYHYFGLAQDLNIVLPSGAWLQMNGPRAQWEASGVPRLIRSMGFRWGGDFKKVEVGAVQGDPVHVDLGKEYPIAQLRTQAARLALPGTLAGFDGRRVPLNLVS